MESIKKLGIFLKFSDQEIPVGQMVRDGKDILFKYKTEYLNNGFNISPKKLSFDSSIQTAERNPFDGLFGVFADSLPDAWGNLLLRRKLSHKRISIQELTALDKLQFVGKNGPGALLYRPVLEENLPIEVVDLDELNHQAEQILSGKSKEIIDDLFIQGGSPGGARPKIFAGYNPTDQTLVHGLEKLPEGYEHWMIKFAADVDASDTANAEMAYYLMATQAGIDMSESLLLNGKSGKKYFATKRFDRIGNNRKHVISAAGMFHDNYEHSQLDYGTLIYETSELINDFRATEQQFRRAVFNVLAHNRDDHSKNFAFLMDESGKWSLAPAFDLTFSSSSQGMHSTTCARNGVNPGKKELLELATLFSIQNGEQIIEQIKSIILEWNHFAEKCNVSKQTKQTIYSKLKEMNSFT